MPDLTTTIGIWLIIVFVEALLQGMGLLQAFLYFVWYPKDPWTVKAAVIALVVFECLQMGAAFANIYGWLITGFGDFQALNNIQLLDMLQLSAVFLSIFVAQAHFARCIYQLHRDNIILPLVIITFSLTALGAGAAQVATAIEAKLYSNLGETKIPTNLQAAFTVATDILITFGLCWRLNAGRGGIQSTNKVLNFLIMTAINRGVFTIFFAALNIILFLSKPGTFYFMIGFMISDKLYMNSLLAVLNTREYAVQLRGTGAHVVEDISMPKFASNSSGSARNAQRIGNFEQLAVSVSTATETANSYHNRSDKIRLEGTEV